MMSTHGTNICVNTSLTTKTSLRRQQAANAVGGVNLGELGSFVEVVTGGYPTLGGILHSRSEVLQHRRLLQQHIQS